MPPGIAPVVPLPGRRGPDHEKVPTVPTPTEPIAIKPHHFADLITAFGSGQVCFEPHPYGHAVHLVARQLQANAELPLAIELGADHICGPCIHNVDGQCDDTIDTSYRPQAPRLKREWNLRLDQRWCRRLRLRPGDRLTARQLGERLRDLAGDIADIYREIPRERTAKRAANLQRGIELFLR
jgi:hypothetical protein